MSALPCLRREGGLSTGDDVSIERVETVKTYPTLLDLIEQARGSGRRLGHDLKMSSESATRATMRCKSCGAKAVIDMFDSVFPDDVGGLAVEVKCPGKARCA